MRGFKAQTWEGGIRVPYILQWKGHLPAGKVDDRPVIQLDILPTALAAAGIEIKPEWKLDGVNLLPYLTGAKPESPHAALYWRFGGQIAIRMGDWKLVKAPGLSAGPAALRGQATTEGAELYNLARDIGERTNLAANEPEKVKELAAAWKAWDAELMEPAWRPPQPSARGGAAGLAQTSNASTTGPWKNGDTLSPADAPRIAGRPLIVSAEIEPESPNGVIVAQGGSANGFSLYLEDGKLAFGVRVARRLTVVKASEPLPHGHFEVEARLAPDGHLALSVAGKAVAEGQAPGIIAVQPARGFSVGRDNGNVGDYTRPNAFLGKIEKVNLHFP